MLFDKTFVETLIMNEIKKNPDNWNPQQYEKFKLERSLPFFDLINLLKGKSYAKAVDLGCGTGELTAHFAKKFNVMDALGIDSSEEMLKKAAGFSSSHLLFRQDLIENFQAESEYDVIISNAAIQWCSEHQQLFGKMVQALKPQGELAIQMPYNFDYVTHTLAEEEVKRMFPHFKLRGNPMSSLENYTYWLYQLGLRDLNCFIKFYIHELSSKQDVFEWVKGTLLTHYENQLSVDEFKKYCSNYREKLEQSLSDERPFFYPFKRIFLYGKKTKENK